MKMKVVKVWINDTLIRLKKDGKTYRVVHPIIEDGKVNWFNLLTGGSWKSLIITIVITLVVIGILNEYASNIQTLLDCFSNPMQLQICKEKFGTNMTSFIIP